MITSVIGKKFLKLYNERYKTDYSAEQFFLDVFYPLFFGKNKYMMTAGNSPLENPKISWDDIILKKEDKKTKIIKEYDSLEKKEDRLNKLLSKIDLGIADASIAVGYPVTDILGTTSGQVSSMSYNIPKDDIYLSWIGAGFGIGIQGGVNILFEEPVILWDIFEGWKLYRELLEKTELLKGNQINTWNGQWLSHKYDRDFRPEAPMDNFSPMNVLGEIFNIETKFWTHILYGISRLKLGKRIVGYIYNIGQTNTTIGFIPFDLEEIRRPYNLYQKLFGSGDLEQIKALYGNETGFINLCKPGVIGLKALRPKGLKEYFEKGTMPKYSDDKNKTIINNTYLIWLMAMLNNQELWDKSQQYAKALFEFSMQSKNGKKDKSNTINELLKAKKQEAFIETLIEVIPEFENIETIKELANLVHTMPDRKSVV